MDLWLVAAATGAGYVAKYWQQNLSSREKDDSSDSLEPQFVNVFRSIREQKDPLRRLGHKRAGKLEDILGKNFQEQIHHDDGDSASGGSHEYSNIILSESYDHVPELGDVYSYNNRSGSRNNRHPKLMSYFYSVQPFGPLHPSEGLAIRPFLVTDGTQVISRASKDFEMETKKHEEHNIRPNLPIRRSMQDIERARSTRPSISKGHGPSDGLLFLLGLMIGTMSNIVTSRREVEELNEKLKQAQNLVEELHEKIEMKDQLSVKEIDWRASSSESSGRNGTPNVRSSYSDQHDSKAEMEEKAEAMSKIEAELEAELERLEFNMKMTSLDNISEFVELDPDMEIDVIPEHPNLKNKINEQRPDAFSSSELDTSEEAIDDLPQDTNYAVSPRELTLRLHEVIESRLKARVLELEAALEGTQRRLSALFDESDRIEQHPFVMNLSGEALGAYNEAYEEISGSKSNFLAGQQSSEEEEWTPMSRESSDDDDEDEELRRRLVEQILRRRGNFQRSNGRSKEETAHY